MPALRKRGGGGASETREGIDEWSCAPYWPDDVHPQVVLWRRRLGLEGDWDIRVITSRW